MVFLTVPLIKFCLKKLFFHPAHFFSSVEKDKDYSKIMFFYVKMMIISSIISLISSITLLIVQNNLKLAIFASLILGAAVSIGLAFLVPFVIAGIIHLGVLIFRGKQGYYNTYKPIAYSLVITVIYTVISTIVSLILNLIHPITNTADLTNPALLLQDKNVILMLAIYLTILVLSLIHSLIFQAIGVSKFQKISKLRAFFAIILTVIIVIIIAILIMAVIISYIPMPAIA